MKTIHFRNLRLFVNAGMTIPECKAHAKLLDTKSGHWNISGNIKEVTCKNCLNRIQKEIDR